MASKARTLKEVINLANKIHNNRYTYIEDREFAPARDIIKIICETHGEFTQRVGHHLEGYGCLKCRYEKHKDTFEQFIIKANKKHNNKYIYPTQTYLGSTSKIKIICPIHGEFEQLARNHLYDNGCPMCSVSKGEDLISNWLIKNNIRFKSQYKLSIPNIARNSNILKIDFFVVHNDKQYFIEYDGIQHFEYIPYFYKGGIIDFEKQQNRDKVLEEFCELHKDKVTLIRFKYTLSDEDILSKLNIIFNHD